MERLDKKILFETAKNEGASEQVIADFEKQFSVEEIQEIVASCDNVDEACEKLCKKYPVLQYDELKKQIDALASQAQGAESDSASEEMVDLNEDDLEAVAGGSIGSWFKKNWAGLVVGGVLTAALCAIPGGAMIGLTVGPMAMQMVNSQAAKSEKTADAKSDNSHNF